MINRDTVLLVGAGAVGLVLWFTRKPIIKTITQIKGNIMDTILKFIIKYNEGGYVSVERAKAIGDAGGETNYGISKRQYPTLDIKNLTIDKAVEIYKKDYVPSVIRLIANESPNMIYQVIDMAINAGPAQALKLYTPGMSVQQYKLNRLNFYKKLKGWSVPVVQKSWTNRTLRNFAG